MATNLLLYSPASYQPSSTKYINRCLPNVLNSSIKNQYNNIYHSNYQDTNYINGLECENNNLVRKLDKAFKDNNDYKHTAHIQEHNIHGLYRSNQEKQVCCITTQDLVDKKAVHSVEQIQENNKLVSDLNKQRCEQKTKFDQMKVNFSQRAQHLNNETAKFMNHVNNLDNELKNHLIDADFDILNLQNNHLSNKSETDEKYIRKLDINRKESEKKEKTLTETLDKQKNHIEALKINNERYIEQKNKLKNEISKTLETKENIKSQITNIESELHSIRYNKLNKEFEHEQTINEQELNKSILLANHQSKKNKLTNEIDRLAKELLEQQEQSTKKELSKQDDNKSKQDDLVDKIYKFNILENNITKEIDINSSNIEYLNKMNQYLEVDKIQLSDTKKIQCQNQECDLNDLKNFNTIIIEKDDTIEKLTGDIEKLHNEVNKNLEEIKILTLQRTDLSTFMTEHRKFIQ